MLTATGKKYGAGIGGNGAASGNGSGCGTVTIHGGVVNAKSTGSGTDGSGAGIGGGGTNTTSGGGSGGSGGIVTIYGGTVNAESANYGAGIGGGGGRGSDATGGSGAAVTIYGGTVNAESISYGAGIGGGGGYITATGGEGGTVTIHGGTVNAKGRAAGAGIGGGGGSGSTATGGIGAAVTIHGGTVTATGNNGASIGGGYGGTGGKGGTVTIYGGTVNADSTNGIGNTGSSAGIGGGAGTTAGGAGGIVTISGGTVTAKGGNGAGIGGGNGRDATGGAGADVTISGGTVNAKSNNNGAGIGGGGSGATGGTGSNVTIDGGEVNAESYYGAGIGGGGIDGGKGGKGGKDDADVTISGGTVTAKSTSGAGIGGGGGGTITSGGKGGTGSNVTIDGGEVNAESRDGAGIGGGGGYSDGGDGAHVTINGGEVKATGFNGAGIGGGYGKDGGDGGTVTISGGNVTAKSTNNGAGIGGGGGKDGGDGGIVTISNGTVTATGNSGAGIGGGAGGSTATGGIGAAVTIHGGTVTATGNNGASIGGGYGGTGGKGGTVTIYGGTVNADSTNGIGNTGSSAGIGGGAGTTAGGAGGIVTISGGTVTATSAQYGAGIGGGGGGDGGGGGNGSNVTISGGTVRATSTNGNSIGGGKSTNSVEGNSRTVTITGGSIDASTISGTPKNKNSDDGKELFKTTVILADAGSGTAIDTISTKYDYPYGTKGMVTGDSGTLYLYLPEGTEITSVTTADDFTFFGSVVVAGSDNTNHAVFRRKFDIRKAVAENGSFTVKVGETENATQAAAEDTVTIITAPDNGYRVKEVHVADSGNNPLVVTQEEDRTYSFTMPDGDVTVRVDFECPTYTLTIIDGVTGDTMDEQPYTAGTQVDVRAGTKDGYRFAYWYSAYVTFDNPFSPEASFTMPGESVTVTAYWTPEDTSERTATLDLTTETTKNSIIDETATEGWLWLPSGDADNVPHLLYLNGANFNITGSDTGLKLPANTKIIVSGDNTIATAATETEYNLTLDYAGQLEITSENGGSFTLNAGAASGGSLPMSSAISTYGNLDVTGNVRLNANAGESNSGSYAIFASGINIKDSAVVTAIGGNGSSSAGIYASGSITIDDDAEVTAISGSASDKSYGIKAVGNIDISNNATVTAIGGSATSLSCGIFSEKSFSSSGKVTAVGGTVSGDNAKSYGIRADGITINGGSGVAMGKTGATNCEPTGNSQIEGDWNAPNQAISWGGAEIPVVEVTLSENSISLINGHTATLTADIYPTNATVTWSSSDENVATVDQNGVVTAVSTGTAYITVGNMNAKCTVTVTHALTGIAITTQPSKIEYTEGESFDSAGMVVTATYSDDQTMSVTDYTVSPDRPLTVNDTSVTVSYTEGGVTMTADVTITVSKPTYTLTVNLNGGSGSTAGGSFTEGTSISINAGVKDGHIFSGWTSSNGGTFADQSSASTTFTMPANDVTITANWVPVYTVTFESNGGSAVPPVSGVLGTIITRPADPTKTGHTFAGWFKDEALTNEWDFTSDTIPEGGVTLYAKWTPIVYTLTVNLNGGSGSTAGGSFTEGTSISINAGVKDGHTFSGWTSSNGGTFADQSSASTTFTMPANDVTITANWVPVYTVTFESNGGSAVPPVSGVLGTIITRPTDPTKTGYTFAGWFKDEQFNFAWDFDNDTMPASDLTLYAKWTINTYTVNFESNGGSTVPPVSGVFGTIITRPAAPTKTGYSFAGWFKDEALTNAWNFASDTIPEGGITLYAKWTANGGGSGGGGGGWTPDPVPTPNPTPTPTSPSTPTPTPAPVDDTYVFTPSIIDEMLEGGQNIKIDNGLQILADIGSIPRGGEDAIIIKVSEIRDADALSEFYEAYPTQQALFKGYEVDVTVESGSQSTPVTGLLDAITLKFKLTPEELRGIDPNTLVVYKEDDYGNVTKLYGTFDRATSTYTVTTTHLCSFYLMAEAASSEPWTSPFADVKDGDWFYSAVAFVSRNGLYLGTSANTFSPDGTMTRAMFWTVLGRLSGEKLTGANVYEQAREWAVAAGITDGTNPDGFITREQIVTILWRCAGQPKIGGNLSAFSDAGSVSDYALNAMVWAVHQGIIEGAGGALRPQDNATRAQAAAILMRFVESRA